MRHTLALSLSGLVVAGLALAWSAGPADADPTYENRPDIRRGERVRVHIDWEGQPGPVRVGWLEGEVASMTEEFVVLQGRFDPEIGFSAGPELVWINRDKVVLIVEQH